MLNMGEISSGTLQFQMSYDKPVTDFTAYR